MDTRLLRRATSAVITVVLVSVSPDAQAPAKPPDHSEEAVVIEQSRTRLRFEKDGTGRRELYMRLRTQSEAGVQQWGQLVFAYNAANERSEIEFVRVRKPDGSIATTSLAAVQDLSSPVERIAPIYTDLRQKHATVESLRPGDTLEFNVVTTIHTPLAPGQFWTEHEFIEDTIVLDEQLDIDVPADQPITLKTRPGYESTTRESGGRRTYRWARANLKKEDDAKKDQKKDEKKPESKIANELKVSAVRLTTFQNWEQVGRWFAALEAPQRTPTPEIRAKAAELIAGRTTDLEKLETLYQFVSTNFRYVSLSLGLGRYQPRPAVDVLREQYGDCKDKHTLLASLITAAGLRASAVLINNGAKLDPDFPSPSQFNHVITKARASGEDVWVDTTAEVAPFRLLPATLRKKQGLVIDSDAPPRLEETPANPPMKSYLVQEVDATLSPAGELTAHVKLTMRGDIELVMRAIFRALPATSWKTLIEQSFGTQGKLSGEVSHSKVSDPASLKDPFELEFDVALKGYVPWKEGTASVPLPFADNTASAPDEDADEDGRIVLGAAPTELSYRLRLQLPPEVTLKAPLSVSVARDYAEYRTSYASAGATFSAERAMLIRQSELSADRKADHAAFTRVVAADTRQLLSLTTSSPTASAAAVDLKATDLNRSGNAALQERNYAEAVALLKRAVELDPNSKVAWNNLGRAYMGLRDVDAAIAAYRRQIEINPYDAYAHNNLGQAYVAQQKYVEAEAAFKKQIEVNPLDQYAPANLGGLYVQRREFESAIAHLERAISLRPKFAWLHLQLGKAHLNLKHEPEAMAAFDRAIELAPNPGSWNDIAYELSLHGLHLDRALQYAESAVASVTAASRNLDIGRVDANALGVVQAIAAYWDTLGWVHVARGDFARGEPFVEAAWRLAQQAEVGDHLAQIYEKTGRRDDAIRTYALALASQRPAEDTRKRLASLLGDGANVDATINAHRDGLVKPRTFAVPGKGTRGKIANVVVLFSSTGGVDGVRFVDGDESLRPLAASVQKVPFGRMFPDDVPAKLLRRGILGCPPQDGSCTLILLLPQDAMPVK